MKSLILLSFLILTGSCNLPEVNQKKGKLFFNDKSNDPKKKSKGAREKSPDSFYRTLFPNALKGTKEAKLREADKIIQKRCISCHSGYHDQLLNLVSNKDWVRFNSYISPGNHKSSLLIQRLKNSGSNMPLGRGSLSEGEVETLKEWINSIRTSSPTSVSFKEAFISRKEKSIQIEVFFNKELSEAINLRLLLTSDQLKQGEDFSIDSTSKVIQPGQRKVSFRLLINKENLVGNKNEIKIDVIKGTNYTLGSIPTLTINLEKEEPENKTQNGLNASYFSELDFKGTKIDQIDQNIDFDWKRLNPVVLPKADKFSIRWSGFLKPKNSGKHQFHLRGDDGYRLFINEEKIIDRWINQSATKVTTSHEIELDQGKLYPFRLEYYENTYDASIQLMWSSRNNPTEVIPRESFFRNTDNSIEKNYFADSFSILRKKCISCHTSSIHNDMSLLDSNEKWTTEGNYIKPGNADQSILIQRLQNYGSNMPLNQEALSQSEVEKLKTWINSLKASNKTQADFKDHFYNLSEGENQYIDVVFNKPAPHQFDVEIQVSRGSAVEGIDYLIEQKINKVPKGSTKTTFFLSTPRDNVVDGDKDLTIKLLYPENTFISSNNEIRVNIRDVDLSYSPQELAFQKAYAIVKAKCISCHSSQIHSVFSSLDTSDKWVLEGNYIKPQKAHQSPLIKRLKNYGSDMPLGKPALTQAELHTLESWINKLEINNKPQLNFSTLDKTILEKNINLEIKFSLSEAIEQDLVINVLIDPSSTLQQEEYELESQSLILKAGHKEASLTVALVNDDIPEEEEFLKLSLSTHQKETVVLGLAKEILINVFDDDSIEDLTLSNSSLELHYPNSIYISSVFLDVFGPSSKSYIDKFINKNNVLFGPKCDVYERSKALSGASEYPELKYCMGSDYGIDLKTKKESSSPIKAVWITNFCEQTINDNRTALEYALSQKSLARTSPITRKNVQKVFSLFYPGKKISTEVADSLISLASSNSKKEWESVTLAICISPEWLIP